MMDERDVEFIHKVPGMLFPTAWDNAFSTSLKCSRPRRDIHFGNTVLDRFEDGFEIKFGLPRGL